jgi:hypothetical protein
MNTLEQFISVYQPEGNESIVFRQMLEQVVQEIKNKAQPTNEAIDMRDYFAAKALQALAAQAVNENQTPEIAAEAAYMFADAMMEARK